MKWLWVLFLVAGCYRNNLYVQQEWVDRETLASSHVGTPDFRQENPPTGPRLLIGWRFPVNWVNQGVWLKTTVRFWDQSQEVIWQEVGTSHGSAALDFFGKRLLTYLVQVVDAEGECLETWEHQLWTERISETIAQPLRS
jgi:hypothetical protein